MIGIQSITPPRAYTLSSAESGFTLIELSIVLVIIGLIIGGILTGQDLINGATIRAQIAQIERLNTAIHTFQGKYGGLPGDISANLVTQFGFTVTPTRAGIAGQGDGNGIVEGYAFSYPMLCDWCSQGETAWFWEDLTSNTGLFEGNLTYAGTVTYPSTITNIGTPSISSILPRAKIGNGVYLYIDAISSINYINLSAVYELNAFGDFYANGGVPGLTVLQAYNIDKKVDDGFPQTGRVLARWEAYDVSAPAVYAWAQGAGVNGPSGTSLTGGTSTTCYDNGSTPGAQQHYSIEQNAGGGLNCALSFQFQ